MVLLGFAALGVATPNVLLADKNSPYAFCPRQLGPYKSEIPETAAAKATSEPEANG